MLLSIFVLLMGSHLFAQDATVEKSLFDYLSKEGVQEIIITADFDSIIDNKFTSDYRDATLQVVGDTVVWDIKVRPRGKFRRRICGFPPLKLEFSKKDLKKKGLLKFDDLKLVTHCLDDPSAKNNILREHLAYELFHHLSPHGFRSQILKVTYVNTGKNNSKLKRMALIIEDEDDLAHRMNAEIVEEFGTEWEALDQKSAGLMAAYQYFVGNTDWSVTMQRNLKLFKVEGQEKLIPIPYDFDMTGFVTPPYGIPNPDLPIKTLQDRYYMGEEQPSAEVVALFQKNKADIIDNIKNFKVLSGAFRKGVLKFVNAFYEELDAGNAFQQVATKKE